uniref:Cytochrome b n=1 Tax=Macrotrachela quadricornifera TaxID=104788 RepID=J7KEF2_9BILA|nr:cytochrome b [Macrotrachela quadricornifera]AFQ96969.1 cytochrome b [Macrotrachela quadricornifera]AFQ96970.1 cytochrome b [Macrotrachela quadricornifera]
MWVLKKNYLVKMLNYFLIDLASPSNLLWFWNFGFMLGISMVIQVLSGFLLSLYYNDSVNYAFYSVNYLMLEVENGYEFRFIHSSGASLLFFLIFIHIGRGIWYKSFYMLEVWESGVLIFLILMGVSFLGYVLPWGQMSFWAATVITNLLYVIPYVGGAVLEWVWGGFSVGGPTLSRFFILHYILPFVILVLSLVHLMFLHVNGSSNSLGVTSINDKVEFHWFYLLKDLVSFLILMLFFSLLLLLMPFVFMDSENFLFVDIMKTPEHIKPEWYFSFAYCILRSIPNKLGGVIGLLMSIVILMLLPLLTKNYIKFNDFLGNYIVVFHYIVFGMLTWLGGCVVEWPYSSLGGIMSILYFILFFV